jgi:hypothetical protein
MLDYLLFKMLRENPKKGLLMLGGILSFFVAVGAFSSYSENKERTLVSAGAGDKSPFAGKLDPFLKTPDKRAPKDAKRTLNGKVLALDYYGKSIDKFHQELPADLRAEKPEEVGTVIWVFSGTERVRDERTGGTVTVSVCEVVVFDVANSEILAQRRFRGALPDRADADGPKPTPQILALLEQLRGNQPPA